MTTGYPLRLIDNAIWAEVKRFAQLDGLTINELLLAIIFEYIETRLTKERKEG